MKEERRKEGKEEERREGKTVIREERSKKRKSYSYHRRITQIYIRESKLKKGRKRTKNVFSRRKVKINTIKSRMKKVGNKIIMTFIYITISFIFHAISLEISFRK